MAVTALVLGIVGIFFAWVPFVGYVMPVLAIIFGFIGKKDESKKGMAITGLVLGIASIVIFKVGFWVLVSIGAMSGV